MIEQIQMLLSLGKQVRIFTARVCSGQPEGDAEKARKAIESWCMLHIGQILPVTAEKDWNLIEFYDDRAIQVEANTGKIMIPEFKIRR